MAVAALALATGNEVQANPRPNVGTVIVYRKAAGATLINPLTLPFGLIGLGVGLIGGGIQDAIPYPLYVDGKLACKLHFGCYQKLELAPGDYVFTQTASKSQFVDRQRVHVVAGQTLYFGYYASSSVSSMFQVTDDQNWAQQVVSKLKPQN